MLSNENTFYDARGNIPIKFAVLDDMIHNGTIKIIEAVDDVLHRDLMRINSEILPLLTEFENERSGQVNIVKEKWIEYLENLDDIDIKTKEFVHELTGRIYWDIWREYYEYVRQQYENLLYQKRMPPIINIPPSKDTIGDLISIAEIEMNETKKKFITVKDKFKEIIEDKIIPRMEETIKRTV